MMKKIFFTLCATLAMIMSISAETIYLKPNSNWTQDNARFAAYFFGNGEKWVDMTDGDGDGLYEVEVPSGYSKVIFCRMNPSASANNWNNKWNQTGDLTIPTDGKNQFTIPSGSWDGATTTWSIYTPAVAVEYTYTIAGSSAVLGSNWSTDDANNDMSKQDDGTYKLVKENVKLVKGTEYQYKVVRDHSWDWSYPSDNATFTVDKSGIYNVTFTFDGKTSLEVETILIKEEIIIPTVALAGTMNDWSTTANVLVLAADSLTASTTIALQVTTDTFKICLDGNWLGNNGTMTRENDGQAWTFKADENNCVLKTDVAGDYIFTWNFEKSQLTVTYPEKPDTPTPDPEPDPEEKVIYLNTGGKSFWEIAESKFFVHAWGDGAADLDAQMTHLEGDIYQVTISESHTNIIFLRQNPSSTAVDWTTSAEGGMLWNKTGDLTIEGNCYKITGWGNDTPVCSGEWVSYSPGVGEVPSPTPIDATIGLAGSMNGWNTTPSQFVKADNNKTASLRIYLEAQTYDFKVVVNTTWLGNTGTMTRESCADWTFQKGDGSDTYNCKLNADVRGYYTFIWALETNKLTVVYPESAEDPTPAPSGYKTIYLNTKNSWCSDNAKFFAHVWGDDEYSDLEMALHVGYVYKVYVPQNYTNIIFARMAPAATEFAWESEYLWNKTADLTIPTDKDCYTIRGWGADQGVWTTYGVDHNQDPLYSTSVPSACPDVMLQGFYWDSNQDKYYGCTRWWNLQQEAADISAYFDLIWLPPSALSSGGVGYIPKQYSNQNSDWGTRAELEQLIQMLHAGGTKVIADMVINHIDGKNGWCSFYEQDFGEYGKFEVDGSYISQNDEMNWDADEYCKGKATGAWEDGYGDEKNYGPARDLAHGDEKVRQMCRAYAKWMVNVMKYDGFRYDYCKGFHMSHVNDYNSNAGAYFSMIEYYDGDPDVLWSRITDAGENTLALDFAMKFNVLNDGIAKFNYAACKSPNCLIGKGKGRWAVNFIDNHDTFERMENENDFGGNDPMHPDIKDRLLQANAYILSMPGVPCIFYPHWKAHGAAIKPMILARKAVGVHSESAVSDEVVDNGYRAYVTGTKGTLILELGAACSECPYGYIEVAAGSGYKMYITYECATPELAITPASITYRTSTMSVSIEAKALAGVPTIYYTLDGSDPKSSDTKEKYTGAITISGTVTLKAYADVDGRQSDVETRVYTYLAPQEEPITVSFQKPSDWSSVYLYSWDNSENKLTGNWPGKELTQINESGFHYHTFSDTDVREIHFIFNNNTGTKSADLLTYEDVCYTWKNNQAVSVSCPIPQEPRDITVKAKVPATWTNTITAWVWATGQEGDVVYPVKDGDWYKVTEYCSALNVIFLNGTDFTTDDNQSEDMVFLEDACIVLEQSGDGKATYEITSCGGTTTDLENVEQSISVLDLTQPMYNILGQRVDANYHGIVIQNGYKYVR